MATSQKLQLETQNLEYSRFVKDQVLTEVQLNEIIDFFEDQHRLTRTCLIGTGIVCGLHLRRTASQVTLSAGTAVTTDGDLLKMEITRYKHFAEYEMPEGGKYDPFVYSDGSQEKTVKLYQLLTDEDKKKSTSSSPRSIKELDSVIADWVAILYLEYYLKDPEKCTPTNCDNLGRRQVARPRLLVLSKSDLDKVIHRDEEETSGDDIYLKYHEAYNSYFNFPVIKPKRVIMNQTVTQNTTALASAYFRATRDGGGALAKAIMDLYQAFKFMIDKSEIINIGQLLQRLAENLNRASNPLHAQYTYDFYRDIIAAYNELRDILYNVAFECCPNIHAFPKHIMLGEPNINYGPQPPKYRHQFYPSPAVTRNRTQVNNAIGMLKRLQLMIMNFEPKEVPSIRITPSKDYDRLLEDRAIPFYFGRPDELTKEWNTRRTLKANEKLNLSYNADQYIPPVPDQTLNPLDYGIDEFDFFRIEGHMGKNYKTVIRELEYLKNSKGLPIDIVAVRLGDPKLSDLNLDDYECYFEDLNTMLRAFQTEISCLLGEGSNFFSGFTARPEFPHINLERYIPPAGQSPWIIKTDLIKNLVLTRNIGKMQVDLSSDLKIEPSDLKAGESVSSGTTGERLSVNLNEQVAAIEQVDLKQDFCDRFLKPVFKVNRIVKETLDLHPDTIGKYVLKALEEPVTTVDDFIEKARNFAAADPDLLKLDENERNVVFEYPVQIIGNLNFVQKFVPGSIREITPAFIIEYRNFSLAFCRRLKVMRARLERHFRTGNYLSRGYESTYLNMLDRMERICCSNEKLEVIMREIERRKAEILANLSFAKFAEKHPGLEHKAGTHRGGTFVIVYAGAPKRTVTPEIFRDITRVTDLANDLTRLRLAEQTLPQYRDIESFAMYIVNNDEKINREEELANFFTINKIQPASAYAELVIKELNTRVTDISRIICKDLTQAPEDVVVADFSLPYLCCSTCPPVAFIVEKEKKTKPEPEPEPKPVSLQISINEFCSHDRSMYPFIVTPEDGEVSTKDASLSNVVFRDQNTLKYLFNPGLMPATQFSKPIGFTVNGQDVPLTVKVFRKPVARISSVVMQVNRAEIYLKLFAEQNPDAEGDFKYNWTFGDGTTAEGRDIEMLFKRAQFEKEIPVTLVVTNGPCTSTDSSRIPVVDEEQPQTCQEIVAIFIQSKQQALNSKTTQEAISLLGNRSLNAIYAAVINAFDGTATIMVRPTAAKILSQLGVIDNLLRQIYEFGSPQLNPQVIRVLEEFIRMLMMLMLNLVRCATTIPDNQTNVIVEHITAFNQQRSKLVSVFSQLNTMKTLENSIVEFAQNFVSKDPRLTTALNTLVKAVRLFV